MLEPRLQTRLLEMLVSSLFLVAAVVFFAYSRELPPGLVKGDVGPATLPRFLSVALGVASGCIILVNLRRGDRALVSIHPRSVTALCLFGLYLFMIERAGYVLATAGFVSAVLLQLGEKNWLRVVLFTAGLTSVVYYAFGTVLKMPLP